MCTTNAPRGRSVGKAGGQDEWASQTDNDGGFDPQTSKFIFFYFHTLHFLCHMFVLFLHCHFFASI